MCTSIHTGPGCLGAVGAIEGLRLALVGGQGDQ